MVSQNCSRVWLWKSRKLCRFVWHTTWWTPWALRSMRDFSGALVRSQWTFCESKENPSWGKESRPLSWTQLLFAVEYCGKTVFCSVLKTFIHDPLVEWSKRGRVGGAFDESSGEIVNEKAVSHINDIDKRLRGIVAKNKGLPLSIEGHVHYLIQVKWTLLFRFRSCIRTEVPNLFLTMYSFSIPTNEHVPYSISTDKDVPLQNFNRWTYTPKTPCDKIFAHDS